MSYAVSVATLPAEPETARDGEPVQPGSAAHPERTQRVRDTVSGEVSEWSVHVRAALSEGACLSGPAIIAEDETSTLVGPGWTATIDVSGMSN